MLTLSRPPKKSCFNFYHFAAVAITIVKVIFNKEREAAVAIIIVWLKLYTRAGVKRGKIELQHF